MNEQPEALRLADMIEMTIPAKYHQHEAAAELRRLHAEVERLRANQQLSVPDGWKLVPVEPTPAMIDQLRFGWSDISTAYVIDRWKRTTAAAAPQPPVVEQSIGGVREAFEAWCHSTGLMQQSHGIVSISSHTDTAWMAWQAAIANLKQPKREPLTDEQEAAAFEAWWRTRQLETFPKDFDKSRLERWGNAYKVDARKAWFARAVIERSHGIK